MRLDKMQRHYVARARDTLHEPDDLAALDERDLGRYVTRLRMALADLLDVTAGRDPLAEGTEHGALSARINAEINAAVARLRQTAEEVDAERRVGTVHAE